MKTLRLLGSIWAILPTFISSVSNAAILDQSFDPDPVTRNAAVNNDFNQAQTFTVGINGQLTEIDVKVLDLVNTDLLFDLRPVVNGVPVESDVSVLATAVIPNSTIPNLPNPADWIAIDISAFGINVTAGQQLAIVLNADTGVGIDWNGADGNQYTSGDAYVRTAGGLWVETIDSISGTGLDWSFRTYVSPIPAPPALFLFGSGLMGLIGIARRKKSA